MSADGVFDRSGTLRRPNWQALARETVAGVRMLVRPAAVVLPSVPRGDGHPVIVLPPFLCSDRLSRHFRAWLRGLGYQVDGWGAGTNLGPRAGTLEQIESLLRARTDASRRRASLIGYSLGGVLARAVAHRHPDRVRRVITICSPFRLPTATPLEPLFHVLAPLHRGRQDFLGCLRAPPPVPTLAIYTSTDGVVAWQSCVDEPGPDRENVDAGGPHTTMLANPLALAAIAERLVRP